MIGHAVRSVGLPAALFQGQIMVAHAEEFLYTAFKDARDERTVGSVVAASSGAYVTPTLSTYEAVSRMWGRPAVVSGWLRLPRAQYVSPTVRLRWNRTFYVHRKLKIYPPISPFSAALPWPSNAPACRFSPGPTHPRCPACSRATPFMPS